MAKKYRGLGKGLNELLSATLGPQGSAELLPSFPLEPQDNFSEDASARVPGQILKYLPVTELKGGPFQPRQTMRHEGLEQLAESIKAQGVLQPIVVRLSSISKNYEIIAGERRWRAAQLAGIDKVPVIVRDVSDEDAMTLALIENIQREDLNPMEEARALKRLADSLSLTHLEVAEAVGKSRTSVTNLLRLLALTEEVQKMLEEGHIEMGHARALLTLSASLQGQVARTIVSRALSVRETEKLVKRIQEGKPAEKAVVTVDPNIKRLEIDLAEKLGAKVNIKHGQKGGLVLIRYHNVDELEGILDHIA
ncbi:MAG: ParB/RepB/Spo0J family partition protein [Candidatus Berkiella sp.]